MPSLNQAVAKFIAFAKHLPKGDLPQRMVDLYRSILADVQTELGEDLSYFNIADQSLERRLVTTSFDEYGKNPVNNYSETLYCNRTVFMTNLEGVIHYLQSKVPETQRMVGFGPAADSAKHR